MPFKDGDISRFDRLRRILGIQNHQQSSGQPIGGIIVDIDELRKECWLGIPQRIRPLAWRILSVRNFELNFSWIYFHFRVISQQIWIAVSWRWSGKGTNIGIMWSNISTQDMMNSTKSHSAKFTLTSQGCVHWSHCFSRKKFKRFVLF